MYCLLYLFSIAAKTSDHRLSDLTQHNFILQFWGSEAFSGSDGAKVKCRQSFIPSACRLSGRICVLFFTSF